MLRPKALKRALSSAPDDWFVSYDGRLYRALAKSDLDRSAESNPRRDHRFNRGTTPSGSFRILYAATDEHTPLFEARRRIQTATEIISVPGPYTHLALIRARLQKLLDLRRDAVIRRLRTNRQEITGNWWECSDDPDGAPTQWLGHVIHDLGIASGIIYPSKYDTGDNLFVVHDTLMPGDEVRPDGNRKI